jgi:hypothetical protein
VTADPTLGGREAGLLETCAPQGSAINKATIAKPDTSARIIEC